MPISFQRYGQIDYPPEYWNSMLVFLRDSITKAGYEPVPMWEDPASSSITPRIVGNIAKVPLAVCVISSFNPNVMMELGMRLCCNKPVLVIFDEHITNLPFDIKDLEAYQIPSHPIYSQYPSIGEKIGEFLHKMDNPGYKSFLDNFNVSKLGTLSGGGKQNNADEINERKLLNLENRVNFLEAELHLGPVSEQRGPTGPSPITDGFEKTGCNWFVAT